MLRLGFIAVYVVLLGSALLGCEAPRAEVQLTDPNVAAYLDLVMPARIEIQRFLTKPVSFAADGNADGMEVVLAAYDGADELTKVAGVVHFELQSRRRSETIGERIAFWPVEIDSQKTMRMYRDRLSRFYDFPLQLKHQTLPAGQYVLSVWVILPTGRRLFDEYEFEYDGRGAPPTRALAVR